MIKVLEKIVYSKSDPILYDSFSKYVYVYACACK